MPKKEGKLFSLTEFPKDMNLDSVSLKAAVKELTPMLIGGVIQKISQLTRLDAVMQIRQIGITHKLLLRFAQENAGIGITYSHLPPAEVPTSFIMMLRKHLQGKKILKIEQNGLERLIKFYIDDKILLLELFNRSNNLYLLSSSGKIMGMLVKDTKEEAQQAGKPYVPLAAPQKPDASLVTFAQSKEIFSEYVGQEAKKVLPSALFGLSPHQAAFILRNAGINASDAFEEKDVLNLAVAVDQWQMLIEDGEYSPVMTASGRLSPWSLEQEGETEFPSLLQALEINSQSAESEDRRTVLIRVLSKAKDKAASILESRIHSLENTKTMDAKRWSGELILEHIGTILPGQSVLELEMDESEVPEEVKAALRLESELAGKSIRGKGKAHPKRGSLALTIADGRVSVRLDPLQSASDNAQMYFKEYRRLQRAVQAVQEPIQKAAEEVEFLEELIYSAESAASVQELEDVRRLWQESKPAHLTQAQTKKQKNRGIQTGPLGPKVFNYQGFRILAGRNPRQNDYLTLKTAAAGDIWLHAQNTPGAHVVIKAAGRKITDDILEAAAIIAARNCKIRTSTYVEVSYCDAKSVRKPKGSHPGKVILRSFKTINVSPHKEIPGLEAADDKKS